MSKFLKICSAVSMAFATFLSITDLPRATYMLLVAILAHMWSEGK
jgi:hypothetical protein